MYLRDISHMIRLLGLLLVGFVVFQVWIKPAYFSPLPPPSELPSETQAVSHVAIPAAEHIAPPDVPQTRLIDPGDAPSQELSLIRDDLERGNYKAVESGLQKFPAKTPATERSKRYVAALWNNLGLQQEKYSGIEVSVNAFKQAVSLDPRNPTALLNLTQAYWGLRDKALTPEFLQRVIQAAPKDPFPRLALADILIDRGKTTEAAQHLRAVEAHVSADPNLRTYFLRLAAKVDRPPSSDSRSTEAVAASAKSPPRQVVESVQASPPATPPAEAPSASAQKVPQAQLSSEASAALRTFKPRGGEPFTIRFDGKENADQLVQIRSILEYAHQEISQKFGHVPMTPIQVVLHPEQKFAAHAGNPAWADSLYDATSVTIHIPMEGALDDLGSLSRVVRHEFAHALLQEKMGMRAQHLPAWFAEGLAIYLAEDPWPDLDDIKHKTLSVIPLSTLQPSWSQLPKESWPAAYAESLTAAQTLIDQYSMYGVRQVMNAIQMGQSFDDAMKQKLSVSYDQFHRAWEKHYASFVHSTNS